MLAIKFAERSLLYGYSLYWMTTQLFLPALYLPKITEITNSIVLDEFPIWRRLMGNGENRGEADPKVVGYFYFIFGCYRKFLILVQIVCLTMYAFINLEVQGDIMRNFGLTRDTDLSYKALYYSPILVKFGALIIYLTWVLIVRPQDWRIYNKYDMFCISHKTQLKFVIILLAIGLPESLIDGFTTNTHLAYANPTRYNVLRLLHGSFKDLPITSLILTGLFRLFALGFNAFRYEPLLNIIYCSTCVSYHLKRINEQLVATQELKPQPSNSVNYTLDRRPSSISDSEVYADDVSMEYTTKVGSAMITNTSFALNFNYPSSQSDSFRSTNWPSSGGSFSRLQASSFGTHSGLTTLSSSNSESNLYSRLAGQNMSTQTTRRSSRTDLKSDSSVPFSIQDKPRLKTITDISQLELHLTRLSFFVCDIDRNASIIVFAMCVVSYIQFIYALFFLLEIIHNYNELPFGIFYCAARLLIPFILFLSGNAMELEAKRMLSELDRIHLQVPSKRPVCKSYGGTMSSLTRVTKILGSIKFTCDNLLNINFDTMRKFFFYTLAAMFVIVQYDALNVLYDRAETSGNRTDEMLKAYLTEI